MGASLPITMRTFLLTLAVVDDLIAIVIIAFACTDGVQAQYLLSPLVPLALFCFLTQRFRTPFFTRGWAIWLILMPIGESPGCSCSRPACTPPSLACYWDLSCRSYM